VVDSKSQGNPYEHLGRVFDDGNAVFKTSPSSWMRVRRRRTVCGDGALPRPSGAQARFHTVVEEGLSGLRNSGTGAQQSAIGSRHDPPVQVDLGRPRSGDYRREQASQCGSPSVVPGGRQIPSGGREIPWTISLNYRIRLATIWTTP